MRIVPVVASCSSVLIAQKLFKMAAYELRAGDVKNKKQSVADLKYRRLQELNSRLKEDLDRPRVRISEAAISLVLPAIVPLYWPSMCLLLSLFTVTNWRFTDKSLELGLG